MNQFLNSLGEENGAAGSIRGDGMERLMDGADLDTAVTVVLATFNGASFLPEQLASLAAQTLAPAELIISDDGSTDDTLELVGEFAKTAPFPVRVVKNPVRLGYADNFLTVAEKATSRFVAFCDQDDRWSPRKLEVCVAALVEGRALLCVHALNVIDAKGLRIGRMSQHIGRTVINKPDGAWNAWGYYLGMTQVFDRKLLTILPQTAQSNLQLRTSARGLDPYNGVTMLAHDKWIEFLARSFGHIATVSAPLADYRLHGGNASVTNDVVKSRWVQLSWAMGLPAVAVLKRPEIARYRANLLQTAAELTQDPRAKRRLQKTAAAWDRTAAHEKRRLEMYEAQRFRTRLPRLGGLLVHGCYRSKWSGGLGSGLLIKDTVVGLLRLRPVKI